MARKQYGTQSNENFWKIMENKVWWKIRCAINLVVVCPIVKQLSATCGCITWIKNTSPVCVRVCLWQEWWRLYILCAVEEMIGYEGECCVFLFVYMPFLLQLFSRWFSVVRIRSHGLNTSCTYCGLFYNGQLQLLFVCHSKCCSAAACACHSLLHPLQ